MVMRASRERLRRELEEADPEKFKRICAAKHT